MVRNQTQVDRKEASVVFLGLAAASLGSFIAADACFLCEISPTFFGVEALALLFGAALGWSIMATRADCITRRDRSRPKDRRAEIRRYLLCSLVLLLCLCADFFLRASPLLLDLEGRHTLVAGAVLTSRAAIMALAIEVTTWIKAAGRGP